MNEETTTDDELVALLEECYDDPDLFNTAILNRPPFWSGAAKGYHGQREWCVDVVRFRKLAIETGNMLGKDYWVAGVILWWLMTRPGSLVIVTGPSQTLLGTVTWKEIRRAVDGCPFDLGVEVSAGAKASPLQVLVDGKGWQCLGYSTTSVERASGQHAEDLLVVVEEASGLDEEIWAAIESLGYSKLVMIGNPIRAEGGFVDACNEAAADKLNGVPPEEACCHRNVPSQAGPDADYTEAELKAMGRKTGLATKTWVDAQKRKYGENSPIYRRQVLAIRPTVSHEALFSPARLDACTTEEARAAVEELSRWAPGKPPRVGRTKLGCDVGEGVGNAATVVAARNDLRILDVAASTFSTADDAVDSMIKLGCKWNARESDWSYDGNGSTGLKMRKALAKQGIKGARCHSGSEGKLVHATNMRTAVAMAFERRLDPTNTPLGQPWRPFYIDPDTPWWQSLREELLALKLGLKGRKSELQRKEDLADDLGRSPDYADAFLMTFYEEALRGF